MTHPSSEKERVIFVDVDDTLIRSYGTKRIPIPNAILYVRDMFEAGHHLYCWSRGGANYSREVAIELGIEDCFLGFLPKPDIVVDDRLEGLLAHCEFVHPSNALARTDRGNDRIQWIVDNATSHPKEILQFRTELNSTEGLGTVVLPIGNGLLITTSNR